MYNCDEADIVKLDADFNDDFDNALLDILGNCKRIYFLDTIGFGIKAKPANSKFNKSVDLLPHNITHIKFGYSFNQRVDNLPFELTWLEFGHSFNQYIDMLPNTITYLVFGFNFNQKVNNLPNSLEYVSFGNSFNQSIDGLPDSIYYINIGSIGLYGFQQDYYFAKFKQRTYKLPNKLENIIICLKNKKYPIKSDFVSKLNELVDNA